MQPIGNRADFQAWNISRYRKGQSTRKKINLSLYTQNNIASLYRKKKKRLVSKEKYINI